ncbi:hypothetical protein NG764_11710 [Aliarcobacter cryaerophilus]|uniref:hypothetical protein n=1 Tax=Aliarcobacter cryaerophilus TaxID=28198 RepID=UPI0021B18B21|nr:hypothetical protein [Aliarcobacter cryaerophilus]MCT7523250.1 hypothetical protein [Aliarcobacter cryaerophilus]
MNKDFIINKILGDLAESICHSHFSALGYDVEYTGIEKFAQRFSKHLNQSTKKSDSSLELYDSIRYYPDLLISRIYDSKGIKKLESFMVEVKYRNEVKDFKDLENQLLWQYRDVIWDKEILYSLNLDENEKVSWKDKNPNILLLEKINKFSDKVKYIKNPLLFYLVVKNPPQNETHIYLNYATYPAWCNIGDDKFSKYTHYLSENGNMNEVYEKSIYPALKAIFCN